jgi:hypothetical protein
MKLPKVATNNIKTGSTVQMMSDLSSINMVVRTRTKKFKARYNKRMSEKMKKKLGFYETR